MPSRKAVGSDPRREASMARKTTTTRRFGTVAVVAVAVALTAGTIQLDLGDRPAKRVSAALTAAEAAAPPVSNFSSPTTGRFVPELD
jgi:hypothetical protein